MACVSGANLTQDSLRISIDNENDKSKNNNNYYNLVEPTDDNTFDQKPWMTEMTELSFDCTIEILGTNTGYAYHPIGRWGNGGTGTASFVLYHFQRYTDDSRTNRLSVYASVDGYGTGNGWRHLTHWTPKLDTYPKTHWYGFQYWRGDIDENGGVTYGQAWLNGEKLGDVITITIQPGGTGTLGSGTGGVYIQSAPDNSFADIQWVKRCNIYDRKISDEEMLNNWQISKERYGL